MKRIRIDLEQVASRDNLLLALHRALKSKRHRPEVMCFLLQCDDNLNQLAKAILQAEMPYGRFREFQIYDPKPRLIYAACFEDRIFHHALMNLAGPVIEKAMLPTSYACRPGMGVHKAAKQVQQNLQRYPWYVQIDIQGYFAAIDHSTLMQVLSRRFKGTVLIKQLQRIIQSYHTLPGKGLPIGSLTSQYFANYYLDGLDRLLSALSQVQAHIRYMDDIIWWCETKRQVKEVLLLVNHYVQNERNLSIKKTLQINKSQHGISYCGYRILPGIIRLSQRRKQQYQLRRLYWESKFNQSEIDAMQLQSAYAAVLGITQNTQSRAWRCENLRLHPPISV